MRKHQNGMGLHSCRFVLWLAVPKIGYGLNHVVDEGCYPRRLAPVGRHGMDRQRRRFPARKQPYYPAGSCLLRAKRRASWCLMWRD
jgi:hypothetical protein